MTVKNPYPPMDPKNQMRKWKTWEMALVAIVGWGVIIFGFLLMLALVAQPLGNLR